MIKTYYKLPQRYGPQLKSLNDMTFPLSADAEPEDSEVKNALRRDKFGRVLFITDNDTVVGKISLYKRSVRFGNSMITLGGIGGVCTHPDFRGQGIASKLMTQAMRGLMNRDCDVAFLCTDIESSWKVNMYGKFGFELLPKGYSFLGNKNKITIRNDGFISPIHSRTLWEKALQTDTPFFIGQGVW